MGRIIFMQIFLFSFIAVNSFPFELSENGWGEFEIQIKLYFTDHLEKTLTFSHFLRLYPLEDPFGIRHSSKGNTVITEHYDEIVCKNS